MITPDYRMDRANRHPPDRVNSTDESKFD